MKDAFLEEAVAASAAPLVAAADSVAAPAETVSEAALYVAAVAPADAPAMAFRFRAVVERPAASAHAPAHAYFLAVFRVSVRSDVRGTGSAADPLC